MRLMRELLQSLVNTEFEKKKPGRLRRPLLEDPNEPLPRSPPPLALTFKPPFPPRLLLLAFPSSLCPSRSVIVCHTPPRLCPGRASRVRSRWRHHLVAVIYLPLSLSLAHLHCAPSLSAYLSFFSAIENHTKPNSKTNKQTNEQSKGPRARDRVSPGASRRHAFRLPQPLSPAIVVLPRSVGRSPS